MICISQTQQFFINT